MPLLTAGVLSWALQAGSLDHLHAWGWQGTDAPRDLKRIHLGSWDDCRSGVGRRLGTVDPSLALQRMGIERPLFGLSIQGPLAKAIAQAAALGCRDGAGTVRTSRTRITAVLVVLALTYLLESVDRKNLDYREKCEAARTARTPGGSIAPGAQCKRSGLALRTSTWYCFARPAVSASGARTHPANH